MTAHETAYEFRVRYSHTDRMGTYYYARVLEWFEAARTEWTRAAGMAYAEMERRGLFLPVVEAHVRYRARAAYDDLLRALTTAAWAGRARVRFDVRIVRADSGEAVVEGHTVHGLVNADGRATRPPAWFARLIEERGAHAP